MSHPKKLPSNGYPPPRKNAELALHCIVLICFYPTILGYIALYIILYYTVPYMHRCIHTCIHTDKQTNIHTYMCIHTYIHTHIHAYTCIHIHIYTCTYPYTYRHIHRCMCPICVYIYIHTYVRCPLTCQHVFVFDLICMCLGVCIYRYKHTGLRRNDKHVPTLKSSLFQTDILPPTRNTAVALCLTMPYYTILYCTVL